MRPILLDTNAYVAFKDNEATICEIIAQTPLIGMSSIVLGELLSGFENGSRTKKNRDELSEFLESSRIRLFSVTSDTANFYSKIYASLKKKGKPIPTNDMWIAAQAFENGCVLCSYDKHFKLIEGLITGTTPTELMI